MSQLSQIVSGNFKRFFDKLKDGQHHFLPMIFGTWKEAQNQTAWLETYDDQFLWLFHDLGTDHCLYAFPKQGKALWFSFVLPSDWNRRFEIFDSSLPQILSWFKAEEKYQYLYGKMEAQDTPPTLLDGYLPSFLRNEFKTEYRMWMKRPSDLPIPPTIDLPPTFYQETVQRGVG